MQPSVLGSMVFCVGDVVKAPFSDGQWYLGTVEQDNGDGTYTLEWFDGDEADRVKALADLKLMRYDPEVKCYQEAEELRRHAEAPRVGAAAAEEPPLETEPMAQASSRIEVLVRHPFQDGEVSVVLPRHAKFKHVKKALARALGSDSILRRGELMRRERGKYRGYKDGAYVGDVREVLVTSADFGVGGGGRLGASLDDGEVSMDDEYIELHRVRSTGSDAAVPAEGAFAPAASVELVAGPHVGKTGAVVEVLGSSGMLTVKLEGSKLVHAVRAADCRLAAQQERTEEPQEVIERLMKIREEPQERYTSALEALQLRPGASDAEIARQYRRLSMRIHPDKCSLADAAAAFQVLVRAHNRLKGRRGPGGDRGPAQEADAVGVEDGLTLRRAVALLKDLRAAFTADAFQAKIESLEFQRDCYSSNTQYLRDRNELFSGVHSAVLPKHGFEGSRSGIYKMLSQMAGFAEHEEFRSMAAELNQLLGVNLLPARWGRVGRACKRHTDVESGAQLAAPAGGYRSLLLGGASSSAAGGLLALARHAHGGDAAEKQAPAAPQEPEGPRPWPADKRPPFRLFIAGSWNEYTPQAMRWESGLFLHQVVMTESCTERFHLLKNGSEEGALYPDREDASPFEGFDILGPNNEGYGLNWQIGKFAEEKMKPRTGVVVVAALDDQGLLRTVDWQKGQLQPAAQSSAARRPQAPAADSASQPDECLLPWETREERPAWEAELDLIGA